MDAVGRGAYDELLHGARSRSSLVSPRMLDPGAKVADLACGTGHAVVLMARRTPHATFTGYDISEEAIARARAEAEQLGLVNARFEVRDIARLTIEDPLDVSSSSTRFTTRPSLPPSLTHQRRASSRGPLRHEGAAGVERPRDNVSNPLAPIFTRSVRCTA